MWLPSAPCQRQPEVAPSNHMTALLDVPEIRECVSPLSVAEYHRLGEFNENGRRTELIRGIIIEKISRSPLHIFIAQKLHNILSGQVMPEFTCFLEGSMTTADSEPQPDVAVVAGTLDQYRASHPTTAELVIEVAVSSLEIDRVKALIYAEAGVKEYWIVCPNDKQVEIYRQPGAQGYAERTVLASPMVLECAVLPGVRVDFGELFA
jgi:Uma2 family endonuclease